MEKVQRNGNKKRCIIGLEDKEMRFNARVTSGYPLSAEGKKNIKENWGAGVMSARWHQNNSGRALASS